MKRHSTVFAVVLGAQCILSSGCHKNAADREEGPPPEDNSPVIHSSISPRPPKGCGSAFWSVHYGDAYKTLRQAEEFKARDRDWYVAELSDRRNEYLLSGISTKFREEWLGSHRTKKDANCIEPLFDEIKTAAARTLPKYHPRGYTHHESGEDGLIKDATKEQLPDAKILGVGVKSKTWDIEKHGNGIPADRWKRGMAWVKSPSFDDGYCRIVYVNIVQDYSGGGSYGDSKANYISMEPAGCP